MEVLWFKMKAKNQENRALLQNNGVAYGKTLSIIKGAPQSCTQTAKWVFKEKGWQKKYLQCHHSYRGSVCYKQLQSHSV